MEKFKINGKWYISDKKTMNRVFEMQRFYEKNNQSNFDFFGKSFGVLLGTCKVRELDSVK